MLEDNIVIVLDLGNYIQSYAEKVPFKAKVVQKYDNAIEVESLTSGRNYEIYYDQVLEALPINQIMGLINLEKYGE